MSTRAETASVDLVGTIVARGGTLALAMALLAGAVRRMEVPR